MDRQNNRETLPLSSMDQLISAGQNQPNYDPGASSGDEYSSTTLPTDNTPLFSKGPNDHGHEMESLDYETIDSVLHNDEAMAKTEQFFHCLNYQRWLVTGVIGFLAGAVAFGIDKSTSLIVDFKLDWASYFYGHCSECLWQPLLFLIGFNVILVTAACILSIWIEPASKGSGIPEVKCYLNGIKVPHVLRLNTLIAKAFGIVFSVSSGLILGKEGPVIHSAAIIAGGVPQGKSTTFKCFDTPLLQDFRNDQEKRDFVSSGVAAGVSAAFGAPIGGVLFSLEEGSSFWNQQLTWRSFYCAMVASFTLNFFRSGMLPGGWGQLDSPGLLDFGNWPGTAKQDLNYNIFYWPGFFVLSVICGLLGALFNGINRRVSLFRKRFISPRKLFQYLECIFWSILTTVVIVLLSFYVFSCLKTQDEIHLDDSQYICPKGFYNDMASILMTDQETTLKRLFHYPSKSFTLPTLCIYTMVYFILGALAYGCSIPGASFIPCLLIGAGIGRSFGLGMHLLFPSWGLNAGIYSIIGAGAFLGGVVRMTIALTVILIETTGQVSLTVPFMISLMVSKAIADMFNEGLYDMHVHLKHIPMLEWEGPIILRKFSATDVMNTPVVCFTNLENVGKIYNVLMNTTHNGFPVISRKHGTVKGLILRSQLITLLTQRAFQREPTTTHSFYTTVTPEDFRAAYPRFPSIQDVTLSTLDYDKFLDLSPYMNLTPHCIQFNANLIRVFRLFRTMGLRHLIVTDQKNMVKGMITRKDLGNVETIVRKRKRMGSTMDRNPPSTFTINQ